MYIMQVGTIKRPGRLLRSNLRLYGRAYAQYGVLHRKMTGCGSCGLLSLCPSLIYNLETFQAYLSMDRREILGQRERQIGLAGIHRSMARQGGKKKSTYQKTRSVSRRSDTPDLSSLYLESARFQSLSRYCTEMSMIVRLCNEQKHAIKHANETEQQYMDKILTGADTFTAAPSITIRKDTVFSCYYSQRHRRIVSWLHVQLRLSWNQTYLYTDS